jgi:DNA invertase Pin-like site-specific DNA recombinase
VIESTSPGGKEAVTNDTRVAIYARVSRPDEREILVNQVRALREFCNSRRFVISRTYSEVVSGASDGHSALNDLLSQASLRRGRPFDGVVFTSLSRVTRGGVGSALEILRRLEQSGCSWWFTDQPILDFDSSTPKLAKDILLAVIAAVDEDYRSRISRATKAAYQRRKNLAGGGPVRWGRPKSTLRQHPSLCPEPVGQPALRRGESDPA